MRFKLLGVREIKKTDFEVQCAICDLITKDPVTCEFLKFDENGELKGKTVIYFCSEFCRKVFACFVAIFLAGFDLKNKDWFQRVSKLQEYLKDLGLSDADIERYSWIICTDFSDDKMNHIGEKALDYLLKLLKK
jgi:hypothetical protein